MHFGSFQQVSASFVRFQQSFSRPGFCYLPRLHVSAPESARVIPSR